MGYMMNAQDCADALGISKAHAYKLIKQMNEELEKDGYLIIHGKVPKAFFNKKFFITDERKRYASL